MEQMKAMAATMLHLRDDIKQVSLQMEEVRGDLAAVNKALGGYCCALSSSGVMWCGVVRYGLTWCSAMYSIVVWCGVI